MLRWRDLRRELRGFDWRMVPLVALVALAAATSYGYHRILLAQRDWIEHTYQVMSALEATLQLMTDAETGQRGYIITGEDAYLAPYSRAVSEVRTQLAKLRQLVHDSLTQLARVDALDVALSEKLGELARTLDVLKNNGADAARVLVQGDSGRERMDRIRILIAQMRLSETNLLVERTLRASRTEHEMLVVTMALTLLSIAARLGLNALLKNRTRV